MLKLGIVAICLLNVRQPRHRSDHEQPHRANRAERYACRKWPQALGAPADSPVLSNRILVKTTVRVDARIDGISLQDDSRIRFMQPRLRSCRRCTYGDFARYLQTFPGVVFNSDESDDIIVAAAIPRKPLPCGWH